jgi:hypothetical protein
MTEQERREAAARRQARYRERLKERAEAHEAGDHSKCRPGQCEGVRPAAADPDAAAPSGADGDAGEGVTRDVTAPPENSASHRSPPAGLGERGQRLWDEMAGLLLDPPHVLLLERCCRKADRLEEMDEARRGRGWIQLVEVPKTDGQVLEVRVDKLMSEIRQTEVALKLDVAELRHAGRPANGTAGMPPTGTPTEPTRGADDDDDEPGAGQYGNVTSISGILAQG